MAEVMIAVEQLSFAYPSQAKVLDQISFQITAGESVALVGANGAGKSTLLNHLNTCLIPQQGRILLQGLTMEKAHLTTLRQRVGMVFQEADHQLFMPTVYQDVAFGPQNLQLPAPQIAQRVEQALQQVGAWELRDKAPFHLSGGEKRLVAIATILAMQPQIIIMDEPSANLDPRARRQLINLLKSLPQTKLIATHDLDLALDVCERTLMLQQGTLIADGPTTDILNDDDLLERGHLEKPWRLQPCRHCGV